MSVIASITTSVDGYIAGPGDVAGTGLGRGGERLHDWVMGGPWTYDDVPEEFVMSEADKAFFDEITGNLGVGICGRGMYDASGRGAAPTRSTGRCSSSPTGPRTRPIRRPASTSSTTSTPRCDGRGKRTEGRDISISGGADIIRQALAAGAVKRRPQV